MSLIEPGGFKTDGSSRSAIVLPLNSLYNKPGLPAVVFRDYLAKGDHTVGDPKKCVAKWFELSELPDPPMRLVLGKDAIGMVRTHLENITKDVDAREDWSSDLTF